MSDARDRLLQAINDCYTETFGPEDDATMLTHYVVVTAHRKIGDNPDSDSDALRRLTTPGQPLWTTLGLLDGEIAYVRDQLVNPDDYGDDAE